MENRIEKIFSREEIEAVKIGDLLPNCFGEWKKVTRIFAKRNDIQGKLFICFYTEFGKDANMSGSIKEGERLETIDRKCDPCPEKEKPQTIRFLKKGIRANGKYISVRYSKSTCLNYPAGTITIYARNYDDLPAELKPINNTEIMTDYFEKDRAYITPDNKYYPEVIKHAE